MSQKHWPHAPPHQLILPGILMVTGATLHKEHFFRSRKRLRFLTETLIERLNFHQWELQSWAVFSNHYHIIVKSPPETAKSLSKCLGQVHQRSASFINELDDQVGREVWHNFYESRLTFQNSYFARLNYVNQNAVRHGLVRQAEDYPWCSVAWFAKNTPKSFQQTIASFKIDKLNIRDDF